MLFLDSSLPLVAQNDAVELIDGSFALWVVQNDRCLSSLTSLGFKKGYPPIVLHASFDSFLFVTLGKGLFSSVILRKRSDRRIQLKKHHHNPGFFTAFRMTGDKWCRLIVQDSLLQNGVVEDGLLESQNKAVEQHIMPSITSHLFRSLPIYMLIFQRFHKLCAKNRKIFF